MDRSTGVMRKHETSRSLPRRPRLPTGVLRAVAFLALAWPLPTSSHAQVMATQTTPRLPAITLLEPKDTKPLAIEADGVRLSVTGGIGMDKDDPFRKAFAPAAPRAAPPFPDQRSSTRPILASDVFEHGMGMLVHANFNDDLYLAAGTYDLLGPELRAIGEIDTRRTDANASYARVGYGFSAGDHEFDFGITHASAHYSPQFGIAAVNGAFGRNRFTDTRVDLGYRTGLGGAHSLWVQASWIRESQDLSGFAARGAATRADAGLQLARMSISYLQDKTLRLSLTAQQVWGTADRIVFAPAPGSGSRNGRPDSRSVIAELTWTPFADRGPGAGPWRSLRFGAQYTAWLQFHGASRNYDGYGTNASANNMAYLYAALRF